MAALCRILLGQAPAWQVLRDHGAVLGYYTLWHVRCSRLRRADGGALRPGIIRGFGGADVHSLRTNVVSTWRTNESQCCVVFNAGSRQHCKPTIALQGLRADPGQLGSLLTYGLGHIQSKVLHSYQIIFLFCGCLTVAFSALVFVFLPDSPMQARFLTSDDKLIAIERLRMNQQGISSGEWRWDHVRDCLLDVKTWLWVAMLMAISIPSGGISTFGYECFGVAY